MNLKQKPALALIVLIISTFNNNNFYILTANAITDKSALVRNLRKLFQQSFLSTRFPLPILSEFILIPCRYLIPNDWKQISIWMKPLQNLLMADNAWVFRKVCFWAESLLIWYQNSLEYCKAVDEALVSSAKFTILISWSPVWPLTPCHYHRNGWQLWLQQHTETWRTGSPGKPPTWQG